MHCYSFIGENENMMLLYLSLNIITILFPFIFSFEKRIQFYKHWKFVIPAIFITASCFIVWDYFFTKWGVWSFNPKYITGIIFYGLPLEEILFFICVPYACMFIYVIVREIILKPASKFYPSVILITTATIFLFIGVWNHDQLYTFISLVSLGLWFLMLVYLKPDYLFTFLIAYAIQLIPFLIVNGILTSLPVVEYNEMHFSSLRVGTIPAEDFAYTGLLMLMNVTIYEWIRNRSLNSVAIKV